MPKRSKHTHADALVWIAYDAVVLPLILISAFKIHRSIWLLCAQQINSIVHIRQNKYMLMCSTDTCTLYQNMYSTCINVHCLNSSRSSIPSPPLPESLLNNLMPVTILVSSFNCCSLSARGNAMNEASSVCGNTLCSAAGRGENERG